MGCTVRPGPPRLASRVLGHGARSGGRGPWHEVLDMHAGGVDLIFPHHEDEIAQSCAFTGEPDFARVLAAWGVPEHPGQQDVEAVWQHHHAARPAAGWRRSRRDPVADVPDPLPPEARPDGRGARCAPGKAHAGWASLPTGWASRPWGSGRPPRFELAARVRAAGHRGDGRGPQCSAGGGRAVRFRPGDEPGTGRTKSAAGRRSGMPGPGRERFWTWLRLRTLNISLTGRQIDAEQGTLGVEPPTENVDDWAVLWAQRRAIAKKARNFNEADEIRDRLKAHGYEVRDTDAGPRW